MKYAVAILVRLMLLAAIMIAAPQAGVTATASAPMMEMADGSPCPARDCARMPDCRMAMPGGAAMFAIPVPELSVVLWPEFAKDVFAMMDTVEDTLSHGDGLRRPPKI